MVMVLCGLKPEVTGLGSIWTEWDIGWTTVKDFFVINRGYGSYGSNRTKTNQSGYNNQIPS